ncbi:DUF3095 domain-containing protein [Sulfurisoma sediminicola]|uniref:DUF3095 family protein n=1 Tax=Sulfurisoma sediminicola TaxID=1381557 RepID=A0A497XDX5_9PROT|nr:DUF3095 domain-containing protein [Sulfurisoma sediminicola]RLJ65181.1 hypothetical protein DFR35_1837 [Sulfurisoma sediminicola]
MADNRHFYRELPALASFAAAVEILQHTPLPEDWWIVIADVVGSTQAIAAGNYKSVNTVGVACIAAVLNVDRAIDMPFVFGGDGATLAVPDGLVERVKPALRGTQELARAAFGLELRVGLVKVGDLKRQDFWVNVAKVRLSPHLTQATFSGRGWNEAERRVKAMDGRDVVRIREDDGPADASFEGFECRWKAVPHFNGHKLSLLVAAMSDDPHANLKTYQAVASRIQAIYGEVADYHPLRPARLHMSLNPATLVAEWKVHTVGDGPWRRLRHFARLLFLNLAGMVMFAANIDTKAIRWSHYREELVDNTDFRKFDGMLRMVIDGSDAQAAELERYLEAEYRAGRLAYGMFKSREALVTCLVQSHSGNHIHFVDGSDGGYALAARSLKKQLERLKADRA